jgi:hypothetical protein
VALVLYLAMPLDIIPDFIPVLGYVDDVLIVVIGAGLLLRSIPPRVLDAHVSRFEATSARPDGTGHQAAPGAPIQWVKSGLSVLLRAEDPAAVLGQVQISKPKGGPANEPPQSCRCLG